ncbi:SDR family NAD(P)-dependent oxidoreductase, partial [Rhizobiaceae sp. 2RAB30]
MKLLEGKNCIITGGGGSIGRATTRLFLDHGANIVLVDLAAPAGFEDERDRVETVAADVGKAADTERYVAAAVARFGP